MREINLTQGQVAIIDDSDYEWLSQWKWCALKTKAGFYAYSGTVGLMHRFILKPGDKIVDHKDRNGLNNQRNNIRLASVSQNKCNSRSHINSTSDYLGVSWDYIKCRWRAQISVNGIFKSLGRFKIERDAALAYNNAALLYHGEFANLNIISCQNQLSQS